MDTLGTFALLKVTAYHAFLLGAFQKPNFLHFLVLLHHPGVVSNLVTSAEIQSYLLTYLRTKFSLLNRIVEFQIEIDIFVI